MQYKFCFDIFQLILLYKTYKKNYYILKNIANLKIKKKRFEEEEFKYSGFYLKNQHSHRIDCIMKWMTVIYKKFSRILIIGFEIKGQIYMVFKKHPVLL